MICIKDSVTLNGMKPDYGALTRLSEAIACNGYYVFTPDAGNSGMLVKGRMFAPAIGISEDPVTGNANGPLGAYLVHHKLVKHNGKCFQFSARQGEAMGRAGTVGVEVRIEQDEPVEVKISGDAIVVFQTELVIP